MRMVLLGVGGVVVLIIGAIIGVWLYWRSPDVPFEVLQAQYATAHSRFADVGGARVHYRDEGRADAPVLVLIHGFGDNFGTWDGWVDALSHDYRLIRIDLPGHGLTRSPPGTGIDAAAFADIVVAVAERAGARRFAIAGNSLGGAVAWQVAVRHPERVQALVLLDSAGWAHPAPKAVPFVFRLLQYRWAREILASIDNTPLISSSLKGEVGTPAVITDALVKRWARLQLAPGHRQVLLLNPGKDIATATDAVLAKIAVPTLIQWGVRDPVIPVDDADRFAKAIPGARVVRYDGVGHLPQIEIPEKSAADVKAFLNPVFGRGAAER